MINLEKLFQKDDEIFIFFAHFLQAITIFISLYISSILDQNILADIFYLNLFFDSDYFLFSIIVFFSHILIFYFVKKHKNYVKTFYYFFFYDLKNLLISFFFSLIIFIVINKKLESYIWFFNSLIFTIFNLFLIKLILNRLYRYLIINNIIQRNVLLIGCFETIKKFIEIYKNKNKKSLIKCCIITDKKNFDYFNELKIPCFKFDKNFFEILNYHYIGQIWLEVSNEKNLTHSVDIEDLLKFPFDIKLFCKNTDRDLLKSFSDKYSIASFNEERKNYLFYSVNNSRFTGLPLFIKFVMDKVFSILIFLITFPILFLSSLLIIIEDGFPLIFTQMRTGWDGRKFKIYKLRTLKKQKFDKSMQVINNDPRLLYVGKYIRRLSIDELPQLINVIIGDMSLVGPRPHMIEHSKKYSGIIKNFLTRHKCNPGITGWAQIHGYRGATPDDILMKKRMDYDTWYLKNWSLSLDLLIMFKTIFAIFRYKAD